jgi:hypothetical protein
MVAMKTRSLFLSLLLGLLCCSVSNATTLITNVTWTGVSGDISDCYYWNIGAPGNFTGGYMYGNQSGVAQMGLNLYTDNTSDPVFNLTADSINTSAFVWTSYIVDVFMNQTFSLSNAVSIIPGNWTASITQPGAPVLGIYSGQIVFTAGTPVAIGDHFKFAYDLGFAGGPSFTFTETLTPVPEPGMLTLLGCGALLLGGFKASRRLRQSPCK